MANLYNLEKFRLKNSAKKPQQGDKVILVPGHRYQKRGIYLM